MLLVHQGIHIEREADLYDCCRSTVTGTHLDDAVACIQQYSFEASHLRRCQLTDIQGWLAEGLYPIVLLNMFPLIARWTMHTVVLTMIEGDIVHYLDPARGQRSDNLVAFEQARLMSGQRVILISGRAK
jgi:hypothetical protein